MSTACRAFCRCLRVLPKRFANFIYLFIPLGLTRIVFRGYLDPIPVGTSGDCPSFLHYNILAPSFVHYSISAGRRKMVDRYVRRYLMVCNMPIFKAFSGSIPFFPNSSPPIRFQNLNRDDWILLVVMVEIYVKKKQVAVEYSLEIEMSCLYCTWLS